MFTSVFQIVLVFLVCTVKYSFVDEQESSPANVTTAIGGEIRLNCSNRDTNVYWIKYAAGSSSEIYSPAKSKNTDKIHHEYRERFSIVAGNSIDLVIKNVSPNDTGMYRCYKADDTDQKYSLIVLGSGITCTISGDPDYNVRKFCGPFTSISITCEINYYGEVPPKIRWKKRRGDDDETVISNDVAVNSSNSFLFRSTVQIQSDDSSADDFTITSYCDGMQKISHQYEWTSLTYKKNCTVENFSTNIQQKNPTTAVTDETSTVENLSTDIQEKEPTTTDADDDKTTNKNLLTIKIIGAVVTILILGGFICLYLWCKSRRNRAFTSCINRQENQNEQDEVLPLLPSRRRMSTESIDLEIVRGIVSLKGKIYIIFQDTSFIRVIGNTEKFVREDDIKIDAVKEPWSLEAYKNDDCLYIPDRKSQCIWRVDVASSKKGLTREICKLCTPYKFSVASGGRLVVPIYPNRFQIQNSEDGSIERTIVLPDDIIEPYYVLETSRGNFVVAHGHEKSHRQGVCEVQHIEKDQCSVVWSFPRDESDRIWNIDQPAMDECGRIFVMDQNNGRILLLDMDGQKILEFKTEKFPYRMCYDREKQQLLVGHYGAVSVYRWKDEERRVSVGSLEEQITNVDIGDLVVAGIAELHGLLNVVFYQKNFIRVYKSVAPFEKKPDKVLKKLIDPFFIASCTINSCFYIADKEREKVLKVDANFIETDWDMVLEEPHRLSVISRGRLLIPKWSSGSLEMYDSDGRHLKFISLPSGIIEPFHAVELSEGVFAVSHGDKRSPRHRLCMIACKSERSKSELTMTFGDERGGYREEDRLNRPRSLAIDERGRVIIADSGNMRIVVLDVGWETFTIVKTTITPERICYCKTSRQIFIGNFGPFYIVAPNNP